MARKRFDEDVLVRLLDFCDEREMRVGQALASVFTDGEKNWHPADHTDRRLFCIENESLEKRITAWLEKQRARREALDNLARAEIADGLYDLVPPVRDGSDE